MQAENSIDIKTQIQIICAIQLIKLEEKYDIIIDYRTVHLNETLKDARHKLMQTKKKLVNEIQMLGDTSHNIFRYMKSLNSYLQIPERLKLIDPILVQYEKDDEFGVVDRLNAIKRYFPAKNGGNAVDLGGNSGFFSLSLVDMGLLDKSIVFDHSESALEAGEILTSMMKLSDKVRFVKKEINIRMIRNVNPVDTIICLNLLHHAGALFDVKEVRNKGWQKYAEEWLHELRRASKIAIIGLGFKRKKPPYWNVDRQSRPYIFKKMAENVGWNISYEANVEDIHLFGPDVAYKISCNEDKTYIHKKQLYRYINSISKKQKYYLYILK